MSEPDPLPLDPAGIAWACAGRLLARGSARPVSAAGTGEHEKSQGLLGAPDSGAPSL